MHTVTKDSKQSVPGPPMKSVLQTVKMQTGMCKYLQPRSGDNGQENFVKTSYEDHWGKRIAAIKKKIDVGESIQHILAHIRPARPHLAKGYNRTAGAIAQRFSALSDWPDTPQVRLAVAAGKFTMAPNFDPLTDIFARSLKHEVVAELGAGPGWNLFEMCNYIGVKARNMRFFAYEYTDAGLEIVKLLAESAKLPISPIRFDYKQPDISHIPANVPALIFSHHSIEQVEDISGSLYEQIAARKAPTTIIHCEPVGWQRIPDFIKARHSNDDIYFYSLISQRLEQIHDTFAPVANAAINSWRCRYNRNALGLINAFSETQNYRKEKVIFDFNHAANTNPVNPSTYIALTLRKQA